MLRLFRAIFILNLGGCIYIYIYIYSDAVEDELYHRVLKMHIFFKTISSHIRFIFMYELP